MDDELRNKIDEAKQKIGIEAAEIIAKDLQIEKWDGKKGCCKWHNEDTPSLLWSDKPGANYLKCFGCGKVYSLLDHLINFYNLTYLEAAEKLLKQAGIDYNFSEKGLKTKKDYRYPPHIQSKNRSLVEKYCFDRRISKRTLDYFDVQQDEKGNVVWHCYDQNDVLKVVKLRPSHKIGEKELKEWYLPDYSNCQVLFGMNKVNPELPLVITEGQFDTLAIFEAGYTNVVSTIGGSENLKFIEENFDWLEQFQKIIFFGDEDEPGRKMRKEVCSRLGNWRTFVAEIPDVLTGLNGNEYRNIKDANELLIRCGPEKIIEIINNAHQTPIPDVVDITDVQDFDLESAPGLYTKIDEFDKALYKFVFGSVCIVTGRAGSGKTSIINQIFVLESLEQGYDVFLFSGEMPKPVLKSWLYTQAAGRERVTVKSEHVRIIQPEVKKSIGEWIRGRVWVYDNEDDNNIDSILNRAESIVRRMGAKIVILDNLMTIGLGNDVNQNNVLQKQKELILKLKSFAFKFNVLVVLISHPRKTLTNDRLTGMDIAGTSDLFNLCQYCFSVRRYTEDERRGEKDTKKGGYRKGKEPIEFDQEIDILKNRFTGTLKRFGMYFDPPSYRFYTKPSTVWHRYKWDKDNKAPIKTNDPNNHKEEPDWAKD